VTIDEMDLIGELKEVEPLQPRPMTRPGPPPHRHSERARHAVGDGPIGPIGPTAAPEVGDPEHGGTGIAAAVAMFAVFGASPCLNLPHSGWEHPLPPSAR